MLAYKSTPLELVEIKAGSDGMQFTAYASTFDNRDHGGDVIEKGAFRASLKARTFRPLLWQHNMDEPIGVEKSLREDSKGLIGTWELVDTPRGLEAYKLLKAGAVRSMSIGYIPDEFSFDDQGDTRILKTVDLLENSVVSLPMNEQALVQSVKHSHCATCAAVLAQEKADDYNTLSLKELARIVAEVAGTFGERTRDLLNKLQAGDFSLTESKREDLLALLETFSGLDAVRSDAQAVLSVTPEQKQESSDPKPGQSALSLAIQLRRARMKARGVEV